MTPEHTNEQPKKYLPEHFGRYIVNERIGLGGFASVYSALDPELNSTVAVKVLADNHSADTEVRRRFIEEARVARQIASDRLVNVYDVGQTEDHRPYVVMQLADRGTLGDRLAEVLEPTTRDLRILIAELTACFEAIHERNIVHRDIKPSNLLLTSLKGRPEDTSNSLVRSDERVVLADFGLARDISGGVSGMTIAGGTAGYMAPEQLRPDGQPDSRADLYAASAIIAAIACGVHPERLNLPESDLPPGLRDVLIKQLSTDPDDRPASASEWGDQLLDALDNGAAQETQEVRQSDIDAALSDSESWAPPPQPEPSATTPPQPPINSWEAPKVATPAPQFASPNSGTQSKPLASYPNFEPQGLANSAQQPAPHTSYSHQAATSSSSSTTLGFMRGVIGLVGSFVVLFFLTFIVFVIEDSNTGPATTLAIILMVIGPMICFFLGMRYLPWPRERR